MADSTLLGILGNKLKYTAQRQQVVSENIANADTPNYKRKDVDKADFGSMVQSSMLNLKTTNPMHIQSSNGSAGPYKVTETDDKVELDMEAIELAKNNLDYSTTTATLKKVNALINDALGGNNN